MRTVILRQLEKLDYSGREQINTICSNLSFSGYDVKKVAITSSVAGEGKSYVTMQIALNMAKRDKRIVLVDADLRRSHMTGSYKMETDGELTGLAHYLTGQRNSSDIVYQTNIDNLFIVPQGRDLSNPVPMLNSNHFTKLIEELSQDFDMVLIDTPPVGLVIDAAEIARNSDGVVFIVSHNTTRRKELLEIVNQIEQTGCPILGCVLNKVSFKDISSRQYYNKYYYSHYDCAYYRRTRNGKKSAGKYQR